MPLFKAEPSPHHLWVVILIIITAAQAAVDSVILKCHRIMVHFHPCPAPIGHRAINALAHFYLNCCIVALSVPVLSPMMRQSIHFRPSLFSGYICPSHRSDHLAMSTDLCLFSVAFRNNMMLATTASNGCMPRRVLAPSLPQEIVCPAANFWSAVP